MADKTTEYDIIFGTNASQVKQEVDELKSSISEVTSITDTNTVASKSNSKAVEKNSEAMDKNAQSVLDNGGAMGILNMLTGGYAQIVKDAVEASTLFTGASKAATVATQASTVAVVSDNTARQLSIIAKVKEYASDVASKVAKLALAGATKVVTVAQWLWNAAVVANPLVALVVSIVAAGAAIYKLTSYLIDSSKANEKATIATKKGIEALDTQSKSMQKNSDALAINNKHKLDMAKASGASNSELRKLALKLAEEEVLVAKNNATLARNTTVREKNTLAILKQAGASDEVIEAQTKLALATDDEFKKQNANLKTAYENRAKVVRDNEVAIAQESTTARQKATEDAKKAEAKRLADKEANSEKARAKKAADAKKAKDDADALGELKVNEESKALKAIQDIKDKTEEEKLARQKERDLAEIEALKQKGVDVTNLLIYNTEKYNALEDELKDRRKKEAKVKEDEDKAKKLEDAKLEAEKEAKFQQDKDNVILASKQNLTDSISSLETIGLTKTKAGQAIAKTLALTQIGLDSAVALSKASTLANAEGVAAQLAFPMIPGAGTVARIASYASTALSVGANIIKAKALLSSGGGGSISGGSAGASPSVNAGSQPSVSFVASNENQIANSINSNEQNKEPIKAYVVSKEVTTAQELDRNLIASTTI